MNISAWDPQGISKNAGGPVKDRHGLIGGALLQGHKNEAPAPSPILRPQQPAGQQPAQHQQQHGEQGMGGFHEPWSDYRKSVWEQGTNALDAAVDRTNDAWGEEMKRRSEAAQEAAKRQHEMSLAQLEQDALDRHSAYEMERDRRKQAFLANLLGTHTVTFGG